MTPDEWKQAKKLFHEALDRPAAERDAFLDGAQAGEAVLSEVRRLLGQQDSSRSFLETPAAAMARDLRGQDAAPTMIGPYRILAVLGEGGMGVVYRAEQDSPRRAVALKVVRPGLVSESMLRRFEHEAEALARLQHPGIAQVYHAGTDGKGSHRRPYFAMELVQGESLLRFIESRQLGTRERLELVIRVCDAVQHAHMKGVIHRDLKPANIIVDESGQPKVLDFGIARVTDSDIRAATVQTDVGQIVGTVPYMSPEQIAGDPGELDTRSDVYSMGVVLYESLTGRLPYDVERKSIVEAARLIREQAPTRLSTTSRGLRGDLDIIAAKALEKDKHRRYQSAADLGADLSRYLNDEPILARPPSTIYQLRKFATRHTGLVGGAATVVVILCAGLVGVLWQRNIARRQATRVSAINAFYLDMLKAADPTRTKGKEMTVKEMLDAAAVQLAEKPTGDVEIDEEIRATLGQTYWQIGSLDKAETLLREAAERAEPVLGKDHDLVLESINLRGLALTTLGRAKEAGPLIERVYTTRLRLKGERDAATLSSMNNWARWLDNNGRSDEGLALIQKAAKIREDLHGPTDRKTLTSVDNVGRVLYNRKRYDEALTWMTRANTGFRAAFGEDDPSTLSSYQNLAELMRARKEFPEAERYAKLCADGRRRVLGMHDRFTLYAINVQGRILMDQKKAADAEPFLRESVEHIRSVSSPSETYFVGWGSILARCLTMQSKYDQSQALLKECEASVASVAGDTTAVRKGLAEAFIDLYTAWNKPEEAAAWRGKLP
jgi:serine/threonine protein kinase/tetratricopeptide (TPR) repeat protein